MKGAYVVAALACASCYSPHAASNVPCSPSGLCPEGQTCDFGKAPPTCVGSVGDGGVKDIQVADIAIDAAVECTTSSQCAASQPVCDTRSHTCRGCVADTDCAPISGGACTEYNGQCVADADTIYVATTGADTGTCTSLAKCATIAFALTQVMATRRTIAVGDGNYASNPGSPIASINNPTGRIVISGPRLDYVSGPALSASTDGVTNPEVFTINGGNDIVLEGMTIGNAPNDGIRSSGAMLLSHVRVTRNSARGINCGIQNQAATHIWAAVIDGNGNEGIYVQNGPLEVLRSVISNNNGGGLAYRSGALTVTSTIIADNGANSSSIGGVQLNNLGGVVPQLQFDTIANNATKNTSASPGLNADVSVPIANSIAYNNIAQSVTSPPQICASCTATYTLFSGTPPIGTGNISGGPSFVSAGDYHIAASSAAHSAADPNATIHFDIDGEPRPQGIGYDMGADEIP